MSTFQTKNCSAPTNFELFFTLVFGFPSSCNPASKIFVRLYNDISIRSLHHNNIETFLQVTICFYQVTSVIRVNLHPVVAWMSRNSLREAFASRKHLATLAKWLSVWFWVLWLWVLIPLQLLSKSSLEYLLSEQSYQVKKNNWKLEK